MATRITTGRTLGLRALASGGRTAVGSYDQIVRYLQRTLGSEHASLFAEPSLRGDEVDWFTNFDSDVRPVRLNDADPAARAVAVANLDRLVADIEGRAVALQKSDRQDERILGDMLARALETPYEESIFLLGVQPVLTFWGYVVDEGQSPENPVRAVIRRARAEQAARAQAAGRSPEGATSRVSEAPVDRPPAPPPHPGVSRVRRGFAGWAPPMALAWAIFAVLLLAIGAMLLRGCAIGLPYAFTGWILNYCPASADAGVLAAIAAERAKQDTLQAEYQQLVREADLARQACQIQRRPSPAPSPSQKPSPTASVSPTPTPTQGPTPTPSPSPSPSRMEIPKTLSSLQGCWKAHEGLTETRNGVDTGKKLDVKFCFNADGSGSRTIRYQEDGATCEGTVQARLNGETLTIDLAEAPCGGGHGKFSAARDACRRADNGEARCDETGEGESKPNFVDFPFTRIDSP